MRTRTARPPMLLVWLTFIFYMPNVEGDMATESHAKRESNPLLQQSVLPYQFPPFDRIRDEQFLPAVEAGMKEQLREIAVIANDKEKPTFNNTIVAMERWGQWLRRAQRIFSNLNAANTNPTLRKVETELAPKLSAHRDAMHLNGKLFARLEQLYRKCS